MITNPEAIRFVNEQIRPLAEEARAFRARIDAASTSWYAGINTQFPNDSTLLNDSRDGEGVSRLTGADVNSLMTIVIAMRDAGNTQIISKPTVRALQV